MIRNFINSNQLLLNIFDQIFHTVIIVDSNARMVYTNYMAEQIIHKKMVGRKVGEIEPSKFLDVLREGKRINNHRHLIESAGLELVTMYLPIMHSDTIIGAIGVGRLIPADRMYDFLLQNSGLKRKVHNKELDKALPEPFHNLIGQDTLYVRALVKGAAAAGSDANVLLLGESGVGKEVFSRAIHISSNRNKNNFVVVNCSAIPENLLESELFGYEPGAFTGASTRGRFGKLEAAHQGTLFLDEIGDMPVHLQAKLLRVIQFKSFERLGGNKTIKVDTRIIAATNRNLWQMGTEGKFRSDLFYRLNVFPINIPPLRERKKDIIPLANLFLSRLLSNTQKNIEFSDYTVEKFLAYKWPGNIRELENAVEHAFVMANTEDAPRILPRHLPENLREANVINKESFIDITDNAGTLSEIVEKFEANVIRHTLKECNFNKAKVSRKLGISNGCLFYRLNKYGIDS
ncbi:MAG: sigma 54-interacting transcriptional regulator [Dethiobacter sp.]|nr:sigma 54-interacting transcriptional regulator [Dethiobacter sp.]